MLYVQLDTNWPDHPKLIRAGLDGMGAHALILCLAKRLESDGWVDRLLLERRYGVPAELMSRLADLHLIEVMDDKVRPWDWLDRNPSQAAIAAIRATKAEAGKRGNHDRWKHPHPFESCPKCHPEAQVVAPCDRVGSHGDRSPTKSESESEVGTGIASSDPGATRVSDEQRELNVSQVAALKRSPFLAGNPNPAAERAQPVVAAGVAGTNQGGNQ